MNRPVLVTGAAGFIGAHLVRRLLQDKYRVAILVRPSADLWRLKDLYSQVELVEADLENSRALAEICTKIQPHGIFHLAASNIQSGVTRGDADVVAVNLLGTKYLIDSLAGIPYEFFIQTGSFMEYGPKDHAVREDERCEPTELYSITKLGATLYGQAVARQTGKPIVACRLFTPYGPLMQQGRLVREVVERAVSGRPIQVTNKIVARDFIAVEDVVDLLLTCMKYAHRSAGEVVNVGTGVATTIETLVETVLAMTGSASEVEWGERPLLPYDSILWQADMTKAKEMLGWEPRVSLREGLRQTIAAYT